jgi:hypothetical protein
MKVTSPTRRVPGTARMPERQNLWILTLCIGNILLADFGIRRHRYKSYSNPTVKQFFEAVLWLRREEDCAGIIQKIAR